jgi:hypothetical protein
MLSVLYSDSWILLRNPFFLRYSVCPQYLSICLLQPFCTVLGLVLYCLVDEFLLVPQSSSNPLKVALGVPSRGHSVEQLIFPVFMQTSFSLLREQTFT